MTFQPCPFCSETEKLDVYCDYYRSDWIIHWVECDECGARGPYKDTEKEAIEKWNEKNEQKR